jgi:DMSO/TMAO reductase YedYZ molybdopterin-dependent catalytic subunit
VAGGTVPFLRRVSVLAVRSGEGPQGVPINKSAEAAHITDEMVGPAYRLEVVHGDRNVTLTREDLQDMTQRTQSLPIACVEGWSASAVWTGIRVRDLLDLVDAPAGRDVDVYSLQPSGFYRHTVLQGNFADDDRTLVALALHGEPLTRDHGEPARLIAPNRPGVLQTKWLARLEVSA